MAAVLKMPYNEVKIAMVEVGKVTKFRCNTPLMIVFSRKNYYYIPSVMNLGWLKKEESLILGVCRYFTICFGRVSPFIAMTSATAESV